MAFTPEQEAKMKALWDQGVRDDATLLAAIGVGTTQPQQAQTPFGATAPTTPQGVVPAPLPEDRWRYPDVPREPGDVGFIEGGGVLGAAVRAPLIGQALGALGWVGENIYDPFATSTLYGIQKLLPGEQELEKTFETAFNSAENADKNWIARTWAGLEAGAEAESGWVWDLPGEGLDLPDWLAGPEAKIDRLDVGRLAAELPLDVVLGKGATKLYRMARPKKLPDPEKAQAKVNTPDAEIDIEAKDPIQANRLADDVAEEQRLTNPDQSIQVAYAFEGEVENWITRQLRASRAAASQLQKALAAATTGKGRRIAPMALARRINARNTANDKIKKLENDYKKQIDDAESAFNKAQDDVNDALKARDDIVRRAGTAPDGNPNIRINPDWDAVDGSVKDAIRGGIPSAFRKEMTDSLNEIKRKAKEASQKERAIKKIREEDKDLGGTIANNLRIARNKRTQLSRALNPDKNKILSILNQTYDIAGREVTGAALLSVIARKKTRDLTMRDIDAYKQILDDPDLANAEVIDRLSDLKSDPDVTLITVKEPRASFSQEQIEKIETSIARLREQRTKTAENLRKIAEDTYENPAAQRSGRDLSLKTKHEPASDFNGDQTTNPISNVTKEARDDIEVRTEGQFLSGFVDRIVDAAIRFRQSAERSLIANWVTKGVLGGSGVGTFHHNVAKFLDATIGSVNQWWVSDSWARMVTAAAESRLQSIPARALNDVHRFIEEIVLSAPGRVAPQMGIRGIPGSLTKGSIERRSVTSEFYDSYPMYNGPDNALNGQWGKQEYLDAVARGDEAAVYANDLYEMFYAHTFHKNGTLADIKKLFISNRKRNPETGEITKGNFKQFDGEIINGKKTFDYQTLFFDKDGKLLDFARREQLFDELFNKTTMYGANHTRFTLNKLGDALDELENILYVDKTDLAKDVITRGRKLMPREVLSFANGRRALSKSDRNQDRYYASIAEGIAAGPGSNGYEFNIIALLTARTKDALTTQVLKDFRDVATDPEYGFALDKKTLAHTFARLADDQDFKNIGEKGQNLIRNVKKSLKKADDDWDASIKKADENRLLMEAEGKLSIQRIDEITTAAKTKANKKWQTAINKANKRVRVQLTTRGAVAAEDFTWPSRMFYANNKEGNLTFVELNHIMGMSTNKAQDLARVNMQDLIVDARVLVNMERAFEGMERLVGTGRLFPGPGKTARSLSKVADFWRFTSTGFDLAFSMTIGLPLLFRNPLRWADVTRYQMSATYNANWLAGALKRDPDLRNTITEIIDMGLGVGDHEVYRFLRKDGSVDISSYLDYLQAPVNMGTKNPFRETGSAIVSAFQRSYNAGSLMNRVHWYKVLKSNYVDADGNLSNQARQSLKHEISNLTGAFNTTDVGRSVSSKTTENFWVGLSPRLTRATASVFADAMRGVYHIAKTRDAGYLRYGLTGGRIGDSPLQKAIAQARREGRELSDREIANFAEITKAVSALHNVGSILTVSISTFYIASYTYYTNQGYSHEQAHNMSMQSVNPTSGKKFLAIKMDNEWYGIGGFWRSLASMHAKLVHASYSAVQGDFEPLAQWKSTDQFANPLLHVLRSRGAPAMNFGGAAVEAVFDVNAAPYDVVETMPQLAWYTTQTFMPFAIQGLIEGDSAAAAVTGFLGARSSMATLADVTVEEGIKRFNLDAVSTRDIAESWIKNDLLGEIVKDQYNLEARDSNSDWGLFFRRKEKLQQDFELEMMKQWAASASDYEMRSIYFQQKKLMNAKLEEYKRSVGIEDDRKKSDDPIKQALNEWYELYDSKEAQAAAISDRWDYIDAERDKLLAKFTPEQKAAVARAGTGIHVEIGRLLTPERQKEYMDTFNARVAWIRENASNELTEDEIESMIGRLRRVMFPEIGVLRGPIPVAERRTRSGGTTGVVAPSSKIIML